MLPDVEAEVSGFLSCWSTRHRETENIFCQISGGQSRKPGCLRFFAGVFLKLEVPGFSFLRPESRRA